MTVYCVLLYHYVCYGFNCTETISVWIMYIHYHAKRLYVFIHSYMYTRVAVLYVCYGSYATVHIRMVYIRIYIMYIK